MMAVAFNSNFNGLPVTSTGPTLAKSQPVDAILRQHAFATCVADAAWQAALAIATKEVVPAIFLRTRTTPRGASGAMRGSITRHRPGQRTCLVHQMRQLLFRLL
jgi:hypothetical protein